MGASSSSSASSDSSGGSRKYDVFINFRGEDTRKSFVCHLYDALNGKALDTFIDSEELRKGDDLSKLLEAIQDSRLSILVFSKNYATSTWCLRELVQILECMDRQSQIVVPIFYDVDPSHVRKLKETFAEAFTKHESDTNVVNEELESWKSSLTRAANLSGYDSKNYQDDNKLIKSIVEDILQKLVHISPSKTDGLIGMDSHITEIDLLLQLGVDDFRIVGIWGMGGIGKSTIARAVYDKISPQFEHKCYLDNVKEGFLTKSGAVQMVEELLSRILKIKDRRTLDGGLSMMRERLGKKKVLLVLDDVDNIDQIDTLIGENPSFGGGSRIILTTRDKKLLSGFLIYKPELFSNEKALELFKRHAFRKTKFSKIYDAISRRAIEYAHGLPLALKVLGDLLDSKTIHEWEYELEKIKKIPITFLDNRIGRVLWASYDGLDEWQKNIFLDIACFFRGKEKDFVAKFHESCGFFPHNGLTVLVERSLVTVSFFGVLEMHDLIQEIGRDIVHREFTKYPGRRSRLWYYEDVLEVLAHNTATEAVEGIILDLSKLNELCVNIEAFVGMKKLRFLQIGANKDVSDHQFPNLFSEHTYYEDCKQYVSGDLKFLSNELRVLVWHGCPLKFLPSDFQTKHLIKINMIRSHIEYTWEGIKPLQSLDCMDLSFSKYLMKTPDFTMATNLSILNLIKCTSLLEVHPSISNVRRLYLLDLRGCSNLEKFPNISGNMERLYILKLDETAITEMPSSVNDLPRLGKLSLSGCRELRSLPSSIHMKSLSSLDLSGCSKLAEFPEISEVMEKLWHLDLEGTAIRELPSSIDNLTKLRCLSMINCTSLVCLPDEICNLACLENLYLTGCSKLSKLPDNFQNLKSLSKYGHFGDYYFHHLEGSGIKQLPFSILRMKLLLCNGRLKALTAPFSSWPTWNPQNPSSSIMEDLDLRNCNVLELSDGIAHLSSLVRLDLSGNKNLESLPAAMNRLAHLTHLRIEGCKRLKSIPELSSSIQYICANDCTSLISIPELSSSIQHIDAHNCTSLENFSTPQLPCVADICFKFINCSKLMATNVFIDIVESAANNQGDDYDFNFRFHMSLPGSCIPDWFNHQCRGSSVTVQLPPDWFATKFKGLAICAISNLELPPDKRHTIEFAHCYANFKADDGWWYDSHFYIQLLPYQFETDDIPLESDHMFLGYINSSSLGEWDDKDERKYTEATFMMVEGTFARLRGWAKIWIDCTWITSFGVRLF